MKLKFKSNNKLFLLLLCFKAYLIYRKTIEKKTSAQTFQKITYNTIILARRAIRFLGVNILYIWKVLAFLDYISPSL